MISDFLRINLPNSGMSDASDKRILAKKYNDWQMLTKKLQNSGMKHFNG